MKSKLIIFLGIFLSMVSLHAFASEEKEKIFLTQIVNQINTMQPLIVAASREQPKNLRIKFHYSAYRDAEGNFHHGLLDDINEIKKGIIDKLNQIPIEP